jgi:hypothetical protein
MSCTIEKGADPRSVAQQPRYDAPSLAPVVDTITPVLQNALSHDTVPPKAKRLLPEHVVKNAQGRLDWQHCA